MPRKRTARRHDSDSGPTPEFAYGHSIVKPVGMTASQIRQLREALGLSTREFACLLGCSWRVVYKWEKGESVPRLVGVRRTLRRLWNERFPRDITREEAETELAIQLRVPLEEAAALLRRFNRGHGESWQDAIARAVRIHLGKLGA